MTTFERLSWDSDFFGVGVGKVTVDTHDFKLEQLSHLVKEGFRLIYIFSREKLEFEHYNLQFVDTKLRYRFDLSRHKVTHKNFPFYTKSYQAEDLLDLAIQAGEFSRFRLDEKIPQSKFETLYEKMVENAVNKTYADDIIVTKCGEEFTGMISLKVKGEIGKVGLIGINYDKRGQKLGTSLINYAKDYFFNKKCAFIEIETQFANIRACRFYEKNGFSLIHQEHIYHLWL